MEYKLGNHHVIKRANGWNIETDAGWCYYQAMTFPWCPVEPFDSFIKAVRWLKENYESLV